MWLRLICACCSTCCISRSLHGARPPSVDACKYRVNASILQAHLVEPVVEPWSAHSPLSRPTLAARGKTSRRRPARCAPTLRRRRRHLAAAGACHCLSAWQLPVVRHPRLSPLPLHLHARAMDFTLQPHPTISKPEGPLLVCVLDGFGETQLLPMLACWTHRRVLSSLVRAPPCPHAAALRPPCRREQDQGRVQRNSRRQHALHRCAQGGAGAVAHAARPRHRGRPAQRRRHGQQRGACFVSVTLCAGVG